MKTIGLVGGMSWESTLEYYRIINETVKRRLGGRNSAKLLLYSMNFADMERVGNDNAAVSAILSSAMTTLHAGGADIALLCSNTAHAWADNLPARPPLLHIADATGARIKAAGLSKVALLGTPYTMEQDFYRKRLSDKYGVETIVPAETDRKRIGSIILDEIFLGKRLDSSREELKAMVSDLESRGARGVILGCTELPLLLKQEHVHLPVFDTLTIHSEAAVEIALR